MHMRRRVAVPLVVVATAASFLTAGAPVHAAPAPAAARWAHGASASAAAVPVAGTGTATARSVRVSSRIAGTGATQAPGPVLGKNGTPAGPTATSAGGGRGATAASLRLTTGSWANRGTASHTAAATPRRSPLSDPSFGGASQATSGCPTTCTTPYVTAAVSPSQIAETVNLSLQVFSKTGTLQCAENLSDLLGALSGLTEPRIQYDNVANRYSMVIASTPSTSTDVPVFFVAASQTSDACGAWWIYNIVLSGKQYPLGGQLNYPYLGQDRTSLLASTNNYTFGSGYLGTGAFSMPKSAVYAGNSFNVTTYSVDFSTAPAVVAGIPTQSTTTTYWLAAVPGTGFDVFSMPTATAGAISFVGTVSEPFSPPSTRISQPGTSQTLNPLDGRLESAVSQDGSVIWFTNVIDFDGLPTVLYGAIDGTTGDLSDALAYHSSTSADFNSSISVSPRGSNLDAIWLNWAYTDTPAGVRASAAINGVAPGGGVPDLIGSDLTLVTGASTTSISTFGAYSSVEVDPSGTSTCAAGLTALSAQEYFTSATQWGTLLARTTFC